jgi:hypothetical protein
MAAAKHKSGWHKRDFSPHEPPICTENREADGTQTATLRTPEKYLKKK